MTDDLISRAAAITLCDEYPYVEGVKEALQDLPAVAASQPSDPLTDPRVVALVEAAKSGLNSLQNTEGDFGIILGSADKLRATLRAIETLRVNGGEA